MLWIAKNGESHQIISCNVHEDKGKHQVWVERPNGKTLKLDESKDRQQVLDVKEAIDYAIEHGHKVLKLN